MEVTSTGVDHTRSLAAALGELIRAGDILVLIGDLGAGKTAFAQGLGAGLGVTDTITSPTFALVQSYRGRLDLHHLDVYRLGQVNEALELIARLDVPAGGSAPPPLAAGARASGSASASGLALPSRAHDAESDAEDEGDEA